ncbi:MAG: biopolymer transporter ExbD, partial [Marichromatium sp.]|nr:biopolymer transporter ExbD [Marichromatium sp.]
MRLDLARRVRRNPISLTPLIDVVFILLLFFMLASHFDQWRALALDARGAKV